MHEVTLLVNIGVALAVAFFGGMIARRIGLPTIVGWMLAEYDPDCLLVPIERTSLTC